MNNITYNIVASNECGQNNVARVEGPATPDIKALYQEFLDHFEFPYPEEFPDMDGHDYWDFRWDWGTKVSLGFREVLVKQLNAPDHEDKYFHHGPVELFVAWLLRDKGFVLLPDDHVFFGDNGPYSRKCFEGQPDNGTPAGRMLMKEEKDART